jgi:hypothetical protein
MYLCYADESGFNGKKYNPKQPVQVMAAICPNVYNFHRTDSEFKEVFNLISRKIPINELKGEQIYRGKGSWHNVSSELRDKVIEYYLNWLIDRKHKLIITAIDNKAFFDLQKRNPENQHFSAIPYPYLLAGLHLAMVIQKVHSSQDSNKGKTLLIFDEQDHFEDQLSDLIFNPPDFIDEFVHFNPKKDKCRLCQIIDTAFFVKSHHSSMTQVVDIVAYLFRLHIEFKSYGSDEAYSGEAQKVARWISQIKSKLLPFKQIYPKGKTPFLQFLCNVKARGLLGE